MFALFLLAVAAVIVIVTLLFLGWRQMDQRIKQAYDDEPEEDLRAMLEQALEHQKHLTSRVEHLETIIASEPWNLSQQTPRDEAGASSAPRTGQRHPHR